SVGRSTPARPYYMHNRSIGLFRLPTNPRPVAHPELRRKRRLDSPWGSRARGLEELYRGGCRMSARTKQKKKRATMRLVYIDFWSALKMSFLISLVLAAITIAVTLLGWSVLDRLGLVASASSFLESIAGAQGASLVAGLTFSTVMTFTLVVSLLE